MSVSASDSPVSIDLPSLLALRHFPAGSPSSRPPRRCAATEGQYRTRLRGRGMEFAEVRAYQAGDDVRSIDWRVTARRGKVHTKLFHEERERPVLLAVDLRRPMFFATRGCFKAVQVARLAALLAWQSLERGDRLGALIFSEGHCLELRPRPGQGAVLELLRHLVEDPAWQRPPHHPFEPDRSLAATLGRLHHVARPGSLILVLSDFSQWDQAAEQQLAQFGRHCELGLWHCYDPLEAELPPAGTYRVSNGAADLSISVDSRAARQRYQEDFAARCGQLESFARQHRCRYMRLRTCDDPVTALRAVTGGGC